MKEILAYTVENTNSGDAPILYTVSRYDEIQVEGRVKNNQIIYEVTSPGIYQAKTYAQENDEVVISTYEYQYFPPERGYRFDSPRDVRDFEKEVLAASKESAITAFQGRSKSLVFDFIFFPARSKNLFVLCPSAIIPGKTPVPHFYRWKWAAQGKFPGNVLVVSDPTFRLDPRLGAGWFVGTREEDATVYFSKVIKIFCEILHINYRNLFFWGSSAGGFIAMQFSKYFPLSTAVAVNAQTDISKYEHHSMLYRIGFKGLSDEEIINTFNNRLSTVANIKNFSNNTVFMVQNILDTHHYQDHFLPFFSAALSTPKPELPEGIHHIPDSPFTTWVYSHPDGHMAETPEMAKMLIKLLRTK